MLANLFQQKKYAPLIALAAREGVNPNTAPLESMLVAASHLELGEIDKAEHICTILKSKLSDRPDFHKLHAACLRSAGKLTESEVIYREALTRFPTDKTLFLNFANLLIDLNKFAEAESVTTRILKQDASSLRAKEILARIKAEQRTSSPEKKTRRREARDTTPSGETLPSFSKTDIAMLDPLAMAFSDTEVSEDQRTRKERKRKNAPPLPQLQTLETEEIAEELLAAAKQALGDKMYEVVIALIKELLVHSESRHQANAYALLGDAYHALQQYDASEACFLTSQSLGAKDTYIHINLVSLACRRADSHLARQRLNTAKDIGISSQHEEKLEAQIQRLEKEGSPPAFSHTSLYPHPKTQQEA